MIVLITSHAYTCHCISFDSTYWSIGLNIILIIFEHDVCIIIRPNCRIFAYLVCTWWYIWALPDCVLHDCPPSAWLHVACLCGSHIYPLISHPLVSPISFLLVLTFASVRPEGRKAWDRPPERGIFGVDSPSLELQAAWRRRGKALRFVAQVRTLYTSSDFHMCKIELNIYWFSHWLSRQLPSISRDPTLGT